VHAIAPAASSRTRAWFAIAGFPSATPPAAPARPSPRWLRSPRLGVGGRPSNVASAVKVACATDARLLRFSRRALEAQLDGATSAKPAPGGIRSFADDPPLLAGREIRDAHRAASAS